MRRRAGSIVLGVLATCVLVSVLWIAPQHRGFAARAYLLVIAALAIRALALEVLRANPLGSRSRAVARSGRPAVPDELIRIERAIASAPVSARETYHRLRPLLREIAADRLETRRRIDLDVEPARARAVLGEEAWALLRGDLPRPTDPHAPGPEPATIGAIVTRLEEI
jgi:hypothetical protein